MCEGGKLEPSGCDLRAEEGYLMRSFCVSCHFGREIAEGGRKVMTYEGESGLGFSFGLKDFFRLDGDPVQ